MDPIELKARREALGLNQEDMAGLLGVTQATLSNWESGTRTPRDPLTVAMRVYQIEDVHDKIIDDLCEIGEHSSAVRDTPEVTLRTYRTDEAYWANDTHAREMGWPAILHRSACAWAKRILEEESGIQATITEWSPSSERF